MPTYRASEPTARPDFAPAGDYEIEVLNAEESVSKAGNDQIELKLKALPDGAVFFDHLVFTESSFWKIDAFRAAIGEKVMPDQDVEIHADDLIGRKGRARLTIEEYNGRKRNKIAAWLLPTPAAANAKGAPSDQPF